MKLTAKIAAILALGFFLVLVFHARWQMRNTSQQAEADMREDAQTVGRLFRPVIARAWRTEGRAAAMYLIRYTNETLDSKNVATKMRLRWVWLDPDIEPDPEAVALTPAVRDKLLDHQELSLVVPGEDGGTLVTYVPVDIGVAGESMGAIQITESRAPLLRYEGAERSELVNTTLILGAISAAIVLIVGTWFVGRPLHKLAEAARRIGAGDLDARVDLSQRDEVGALARTINKTAENLASALEQVRHADRLASVGTLAAGVAHELGTPLAVVSGRAKLIADGTVPAEKVKSNAESIARQADRMAEIIRQLLDFARRREVSLTHRDLAALAEQTLEMLRPMAKKRGVELVLDAPRQRIRTAADDTQLQQVFTNLVMNAIDASSESEVTVAICRTRATRPGNPDAREGDYVRCEIRDRGEGIPEEHRARLFEPFFTTKPVGQGTGLGLAVSYGIVADHGGWIDVDSQVGQGTTFSVYLPLEDVSDSGTSSGRR